MRNGLIVVAVVAVTVALYLAVPHLLPAGHLEYRGEQVRLSRWYWSYDDYKNDPDNIAPNERARVQQLVLSAPVEHHFADRKAMVHGIGELAFPGYGRGSLGVPAGSELAGLSIEVPGAELDRVFLFRKNPQGYELVDDFTAPNMPGILELRVEGDTVVYSAYGGKELLRRKLPGRNQS